MQGTTVAGLPGTAADCHADTAAHGLRNPSTRLLDSTHVLPCHACCAHTIPCAHCAQVLRLLGTGGEGETWLCVDQRNKQEVAIKLVRRPIPRSITQIIQVCMAAGFKAQVSKRRVEGAGGVGWVWATVSRELGLITNVQQDKPASRRSEPGLQHR